MVITKIKRGIYLTMLIGSLLLYLLVSAQKLAAVASVTITSPMSGANLPAGTVSVTGTAGAGQTVVISRDNTPLKMVIADGSGNWSTTIENLTAGSITLTAKAIENSQYAYFGAVTSDFSSSTVNRLRLSDNTVNPGGGGWPVAVSSTKLVPGPVYSRENGILYYLPFGDPTAVPVMFDINNPADFTLPTGYEVSPDVMGGVFNSDGTKWYGLNSDLGSVSVLDVAANTQVGLISVGGEPQSGLLGSDGRIYVSNSADNTISVIDTTNDVVAETFTAPSCPTVGGLAGMTFPQGEDYFYVACAMDGVIFKLSINNGSHLGTIDISTTQQTIASILLTPDNKSMYVSGIYGTAWQEQISVIDVTSGAVSETITLPGPSFSGILSPDGQYIYAGIQGAFDGNTIAVVSTATNTVVDTIDTSSVGVPGVVAFGPASYAATSVTFMVNSVSTTQLGLANTGQSRPIILGGSLIAVTSSVIVAARYRKYKFWSAK